MTQDKRRQEVSLAKYYRLALSAFFYGFGFKRRDRAEADYKTYLCDYQYQNQTWSIEISAVSFEEAQQRLDALKYAEIVGELKLSIPIPIRQSWLEKFRR